ncbi:hypothetical protein [Streptomyces sp. NPDC058305]|uniref:hypothetical protein n=1 Tax=Streptomyces sp. NPDC058305 TaxID=3346438 RepID=UPI0036DFD167
MTISDSGRQRSSALRWSLLLKPPRERPRPTIGSRDLAYARQVVRVIQEDLPLQVNPQGDETVPPRVRAA